MPIPTIQPNGYRAVVAEFHLHVGPEAAGFHLEARGTALVYEVIEHRLGGLGWSGPGKAGPPALAGVGGECELADYEKTTPGIKNGPVESAGIVGEDSEVEYLFLQVVSVFAGVILLDAKEKAEAGPDTSQGIAVDGDGCTRDSLEESLQRGLGVRGGGHLVGALFGGRLRLGL